MSIFMYEYDCFFWESGNEDIRYGCREMIKNENLVYFLWCDGWWMDDTSDREWEDLIVLKLYMFQFNLNFLIRQFPVEKQERKISFIRAMRY